MKWQHCRAIVKEVPSPIAKINVLWVVEFHLFLLSLAKSDHTTRHPAFTSGQKTRFLCCGWLRQARCQPQLHLRDNSLYGQGLLHHCSVSEQESPGYASTWAAKLSHGLSLALWCVNTEWQWGSSSSDLLKLWMKIHGAALEEVASEESVIRPHSMDERRMWRTLNM